MESEQEHESNHENSIVTDDEDQFLDEIIQEGETRNAEMIEDTKNNQMDLGEQPNELRPEDKQVLDKKKEETNPTTETVLMPRRSKRTRMQLARLTMLQDMIEHS
jgi:hypothetical protein